MTHCLRSVKGLAVSGLGNEFLCRVSDGVANHSDLAQLFIVTARQF